MYRASEIVWKETLAAYFKDQSQNCECSISVHWRIFHTYKITDIYVYIYIYIYSIVYYLNQHVSATPVTIIRVSCNIRLSIQTDVQKCMIKPRDIHFCTVICILIVLLLCDTVMMVTGVAKTCRWRIIRDGIYLCMWMCRFTCRDKTVPTLSSRDWGK